MAEYNLKKLKRLELVEIIEKLQEDLEQTKKENEELRAQMNTRRMELQEIGSIAEASLKVNKVFEAAQAAADQYLENIRLQQDELAQKSEEILSEARRQADDIVSKAKGDASQMGTDVRKLIEAFISASANTREESDDHTAKAEEPENE